MAASLFDILKSIRPGKGYVCYGEDPNTLFSPDGHEIPSVAEIEAARPAVEAAIDAAALIPKRADVRSALRAQWDALPAWIRGPYRPLFDAANALLDEGDDDAAKAMINEAIIALGGIDNSGQAPC